MPPADAQQLPSSLRHYVDLNPRAFSSNSSSSSNSSASSSTDDLLQCFLPSPFSLPSLPTLLPIAASPSTSYCSASVSVTKCLRKHSHNNPVVSVVRFFVRGKSSGKPPDKVCGLSSRLQCKIGEQDDKPPNVVDTVNSTMKVYKHLFAGAMAAIVSRTVVAPLERLKLEYLVRGATADVHHVVKAIFDSEGMVGFWKGNLVNIIRTAPFKSINFYAYDTLRKQITRVSGRKEIRNYEKLAAGATAGILATIICFPMDTVRTRIVAPGGDSFGGIVGCCRHLITNQGFTSLYAGLAPALISMAPASAVFYGVYDILKSRYLASPAGKEALKRRRAAGSSMELDPMRTLLYGAIAGVCAETVTYPLEVVRRRLQLQDAGRRLTLVGTAKALVDQGGVSAFYAGLLPSTVQVLPSAALSYFVYEWLKISMKV